MDAKTQHDIYIEMLVKWEIKDIEVYDFQILFIVRIKWYQWLLTKMETYRLPQTNRLHIRWSLQSHWEKVKQYGSD